jgi:hypothetical protein
MQMRVVNGFCVCGCGQKFVQNLSHTLVLKKKKKKTEEVEELWWWSHQEDWIWLGP